MVSELEEKGLLEGKDGLCTLTEEGLSVERRIQSL
jgi:Mn-dependent DtxR family transcriptional regulator